MYKNFDKILEENYTFIKGENLTIDRPIQLKSNRSFKVMNEFPLILVLTYNIYNEYIETYIQANIPVIISLFKNLKPNPFKNSEYDASKRYQINLYEDYLYFLTKLEYLIAFLLKIKDQVYEGLFRKYADDIVKAIIHVLDNAPKDNILTRKEILAITKSLIKPFAEVFYERNQYFRNEENLLGKSVISYDFIFYEVNKIIFTLIDCIHIRMSFDEKASLVEELVNKINNYKIGYEFKLFIFYYINSIMDTMKNNQNDPNNRMRLININNYILRELSYFFEILSKIFTSLENYFIFDKNSEKANKYEILDKNLFEDETIKIPDINNIMQTNIHKVYELLLNNEYEKFINPDETKFIVDLLKHSNALLKLCAHLIHVESQVQYNVVQQNSSGSNLRPSDNLIMQNTAYSSTKKAYFLRKIFRAYFNICEKLFKNHTHGQNDEGSGKIYEINLVNIYITLPLPICTNVFHKLLPFIFKAVLANSKVCPVKNCLLSITIDTIFDISNLGPNIDPSQNAIRKELFDIFLDYFIGKIHYIGNNLKSYEENSKYSGISMSVIINIFKSLFKFLLNFPLEEKTKQKITNFLVACLILTKNSKYFGNYIYVIRCLFKNLLNISNHSNPHGQFEFYKETIHLVYGIMKYMISIKEDFPFLKEMLTEIIMIFPIKFKYMIDYAKIVFPSLIDALNMNQEIIPVGLQYLEQWMNALFHKPENVKPFLQNNINLLTTLLTSHLYKNYAISLNSLKLLSKFGGRSRNYMEDKLINPKTSPTNILVIDLLEISSNKIIEFPIDNIVDLCIKIVTNYKRHSEKNWLNQIRTSFKTLKACFITFIGEKIDENYLKDCVESLKKQSYSDFQTNYEGKGYFRKLNVLEEQTKINVIYRKAEHFLVEKLLRGLFLCCTIPEIEDEIKDFVKLICDYFTLVMIVKDSNNKFIQIFEIDPTIILDIICEFLFSNNPTVFKNNNQTCISIAMKLINIIIDTIETIFDKNYDYIKNLEIVEIIFMKFLNACYNNEWSKKGGGLVTLLILIKRFSKDIIFTYLQQIIRAVFLVTNNYSSTVKIKYEGDCEQIITSLITKFILNVEITEPETRQAGMEVDGEHPQQDITQQKNYDQMYKALCLFQEEILNNLHSMSEYSRKIAALAYQNIMKHKHLCNLPSIILLIDKINKDDFFRYLGKSAVLSKSQKTRIEIEDGNLINLQKEMHLNQEFITKNLDLVTVENIKLNKKLSYLMSGLANKLELNSSNFLPMISFCNGLNFFFKSNPDYFIEYILYSKLSVESFLKLIKNLIDILTSDMFLYIEINRKIHDIQFNSKFKYFFIEKFYSTKQLQLNLNIKDEDKIIDIETDIPDEHMAEVMKYIFQTHHNYIFDQYVHTNQFYTSIEPYICEIFPILSNKMKMIKKFINFLKNIFSNKKFQAKMKEKVESVYLDKIFLDKFNDYKNKCTNLIFRFIIYREEKILLKNAKKYVRKLLKVESSTRNLLPEEELKKCIKPVLEQVANNRLISFKLVESLAILIKLLSTNFNETLGKKLLMSIENYMTTQEQNLDYTFVHAILSLFSLLKPVQIKELFKEILEVIFKLEKESLIKVRNNSIFNSKYKNKIIKLLSNFSDILVSFFFDYICSNPVDLNFFYFFKKLIKEESSYVIRESFGKVFHKNLMELLFQPIQASNMIMAFKTFKILVKKSPSVLNMDDKLIIYLNDYLIQKLQIYSDLKPEEETHFEELLKCIVRVNIYFCTAFTKHPEFIFNNIHFLRKTKLNRVKEKIKFFMIKEILNNLTNKRVFSIVECFIRNFNKIVASNYLTETLKYLINPLLINYIKDKMKEEYLEKHFTKNLFRLMFTDSIKKFYDDSANLEIIKLLIILISYFFNPNITQRESQNREESSQNVNVIANFLTLKYNSTSHALNLYSCLGLSLFSLLYNKQCDKMLQQLNVFFFKQNQYDHLNIINLCFELIIPFCMSRPPEESISVMKNLKLYLNDRSVNITQFFNIFYLILKYPEMFLVHKIHLSNITIQFILKSVQQHINSTPQQKKITIQLLGLIINWFKNEKVDKSDEKYLQIEKLKDNSLLLLTKYYKMLLIHQSPDPDYMEIVRKYLIYIKKLLKISDFHFKKFMLITETEQTQGIKVFSPAYLYLIKIAILYCQKNSIYQHIDYFFYLLKQLNVETINIKAQNDVTLIVKSIINKDLFYQLNEHREAVDEETKNKADLIIIKNIKEMFETQHSTFVKKKGRIIPDVDFEQVNQMDIKQTEIMKDLLNNFKNKTHSLSPEKLYEVFPHFDFRYFSIFYFYIMKWNTNLDKYPMNKDSVEAIIKLCESLCKVFYESWYIYTLLILQLLKEDEERIKKTFFDNADCDYFTSNSNFLFNLKSVEQLEKIKNDNSSKLLSFDKKTSVFELIMETIFIGFYIAFNNNFLLSTFKNNIKKALLVLIEIMHNTNIHFILESFIEMLIKSPIYSPSDHNSFILSLLKIYDFHNKKISNTLLFLIIDYMNTYKSEYDKNIKDIIKILMFSSRFHEYKMRKKIFKIYEKFNGLSLVAKLKFIFQVDQKIPEVDNNSWLPYSVDFLLHHFQLNENINRKDYCSKLRKLNPREEQKNEKNDKNDKMEDVMEKIEDVMEKNQHTTGMIVEEIQNEPSKIFPWIENYNKEITNLKSKNILIPIRDIVLGDISISQKMWFSIFPQVWKILSKDEQEMLSIYMNEFLTSLTTLNSSQKGPFIVKAMLESFANCYPLVKVNPEVLYILAKNHNSWNSASFYLEKMLISDIEKERCFTSLNKVMETLKEDDHSFGLKRYITENKLTIYGLSFLQSNNFNKSEEIFLVAMKTYKDHMDKINLDIFNLNLNSNDSTLRNEFPNKPDLGIWEQGLIDCYRNTNRWGNLLSLAEETNNLEIKIESLWHLERWDDIEAMNVQKYHYLAKINQIYAMMKQDNARQDSTYQTKCMECIRTIFSDFSLFPPNFEKLNYHYYLIFQLIVEAWESTNTLKEIEKNNQERKPSDFRENLIMWRDRIPHPCEGFYSLKSILDPRNFLFDILREQMKNLYTSQGGSNVIANFFPNISDHIWNNMIFLKYARKLQLLDVYIEYNEKFNKSIAGYESNYPIELYMKNMEHFKFIRKINQNYQKGIEIVDELLRALPNSTSSFNMGTGVENEIKASYLGTKGYFNFKMNRIIEAQECFKEAVTMNQCDAKIWADWAEMSDKLLEYSKDSRVESTWFDNTMINYFMTIVFKLDKAKFIIPRIFAILKKFSTTNVIDGRFDKYFDNIPTWVFIFWIPQLFEFLKFPNQNYFSMTFLKKIAETYPQYIYYPLVSLKENNEIKQKNEELKKIIENSDKHYQITNKIDLIINEISSKLDRSVDEIILNHLITYLDIQYCQSASEAIEKVSSYLAKLGRNLNIKLPYLDSLIKDFSLIFKDKTSSIFSLVEKIRHWRYFIQSKLATESNFKDLNNILNNKLYNTNFEEVEIPGYFVNKIVEPSAENRVYITRFESEYSFKFINFSNKKLLVRGSNEKLFNYTILFEKYKENQENKLLQFQTLLNCIFTSNKNTYKSNVKFIIPIKYTITNLLKLVQEDTNQYYMSEVFDFCMQKYGFDPEVAYTIYEEEFKKQNQNPALANYKNPEILKKVFYKMTDLVPLYNLKNFIHKFIINCDEIFIFRKQFATSYAINNFLTYIFKLQEVLNLNKISFNKETGSITFHDIKYRGYQEYSKIISNNRTDIVPFRISRNINVSI
jgi:hypothetical protein